MCSAAINNRRAGSCPAVVGRAQGASGGVGPHPTFCGDGCARNGFDDECSFFRDGSPLPPTEKHPPVGAVSSRRKNRQLEPDQFSLATELTEGTEMKCSSYSIAITRRRAGSYPAVPGRRSILQRRTFPADHAETGLTAVGSSCRNPVTSPRSQSGPRSHSLESGR